MSTFDPSDNVGIDVDIRLDPVPWAPSTRQVAALIPYMTHGDESNAERGDFDQTTSPPRTVALELIDQACREVLSSISGHDVPDVDLADAQRLAKLQAAVLILASRGVGRDDDDNVGRYTAAYLAGLNSFSDRVLARFTAIYLA